MVAFKNLALLIVLTGHTLSLPTAVELDARAAALSCPGSNNAAYTASSGRQYTIECGADHPGNMRVVYARTMESCVSACDSTDGCVAVSWVRRFGACYMKSSVLPATSNNRVWGAVLRSGSPAGTTAAAPSTAAAPPPPPLVRPQQLPLLRLALQQLLLPPGVSAVLHTTPPLSRMLSPPFQR